MSALELTPLPSLQDRRQSPRLRPDNVPVLLGRGKGVLVDLSEHGARVRHDVQAPRGSNVRLTFAWHKERFAASAEVLSSRVVALGMADVPTVYESRLRFRPLTDAAADLLSRVLGSVEDADIRKRVANLRGWEDDSTPATRSPAATGSYLRCRLIGNRWERKLTHDSAAPADGFLLPESTTPKEVDSLCETYRDLDADGRQLIRLLAATAMGD
jgi:hypothetical protein